MIIMYGERAAVLRRSVPVLTPVLGETLQALSLLNNGLSHLEQSRLFLFLDFTPLTS